MAARKKRFKSKREVEEESLQDTFKDEDFQDIMQEFKELVYRKPRTASEHEAVITQASIIRQKIVFKLNDLYPMKHFLEEELMELRKDAVEEGEYRREAIQTSLSLSPKYRDVYSRLCMISSAITQLDTTRWEVLNFQNSSPVFREMTANIEQGDSHDYQQRKNAKKQKK